MVYFVIAVQRGDEAHVGIPSLGAGGEMEACLVHRQVVRAGLERFDLLV